MRKHILSKQKCSFMTRTPSMMSGEHQAVLITRYHHYREASFCLGASQAQWHCLEMIDNETSRTTRPGIRGNGSHFTTMTYSTEPGDISLTALERPNQSPDLDTIENLWRDLKMDVHRHVPDKLPKSRCGKLVYTYPRRPEAVLKYGYENLCQEKSKYIWKKKIIENLLKPMHVISMTSCTWCIFSH